MVRYHELIALNMVHELYTGHQETGIAIEGDTLLVGGRIIEITRPSRFNGKSSVWQPIIIRHKNEVDND